MLDEINVFLPRAGDFLKLVSPKRIKHKCLFSRTGEFSVEKGIKNA